MTLDERIKDWKDTNESMRAKHVAEFREWASVFIDDLIEAYEEAKKTVSDVLPNTGDGVPIIPKMKLWDSNGDSWIVDFVSIGTGPISAGRHEQGAKENCERPDGTHVIVHETRYGRLKWWKCFADREAALAAAKGTP